jgi:Leucine-rich repeat (LRR) protein
MIKILIELNDLIQGSFVKLLIIKYRAKFFSNNLDGKFKTEKIHKDINKY